MNYIVKPAATLFITAAVTIAALSVVYERTLQPIERQRQRTQEAAMSAVLPQASGFRELTAQTSGSITAIFEGLRAGELIGYVVELSPVGYSGNIDMVVGICALDEKITGMRILRHSETPGLGALAAREAFYRRFDGRPLVPLTVVRYATGEHEISAITSSTITTRAITNAVNEVVAWFKSTGKQFEGRGGQ